MKQILIALLLAFTTSTVINAQKQSSIEKDSTENVKVTLSKKTDTKADESNTTVTVIGVDTTDMDTTVDALWALVGRPVFADKVFRQRLSGCNGLFGKAVTGFPVLVAEEKDYKQDKYGQSEDLLIMFMGIGQWIIGSKQQKTDDVDPFRMNVSRKRDIDTAAPSATQQEERNGEKSDENKWANSTIYR